MIERPILFSTPMVQAILVGNKTQTRRVVKPRKDLLFGCLLQPHELAGEVNAGDTLNCPYGQVGDQLWVRETFSTDNCNEGECYYKASINDRDWYELNFDEISEMRWKPSIHMPRLASRIQLEIENIRVERLHDISEQDAIAEGVERWTVGMDKQPESGWWRDYSYTDEEAAAGYPPLLSAKDSFRTLWESINGAGSWDLNPWVWAISFKRVEVPA